MCPFRNQFEDDRKERVGGRLDQDMGVLFEYPHVPLGRMDDGLADPVIEFGVGQFEHREWVFFL